MIPEDSPTMPKHSPPPWRAGLDLPQVTNNDPDPRLVWSNSLLIADCRSPWISRSEAEANASLMASSLAMRDALRDLVRAFESGDESAMLAAVDHARRVISEPSPVRRAPVVIHGPIQQGPHRDAQGNAIDWCDP